MSPKSRLAKKGRPIYVPEARAPGNDTQVCVGVSDPTSSSDPMWYMCFRDDAVEVLFKKLGTTMPIDGKELRFNGKSTSRYSEETFRQLLKDRDIVEFNIVPIDTPKGIVIEKTDKSGSNTKRSNKRSYGSVKENAPKLAAVKFHKDVLGKPREIQDAAVHAGLNQLNKLKLLLQKSDFDRKLVGEWLDDLERIIPQANTPRTIIGIIGNTGAGKSSMLNALLDQEVFIPTSSHRACTATITEVSYNADDGFRAVIHFVDAETWINDLKHLLADQTVDGDRDEERSVDGDLIHLPDTNLML